MNRCTAREDPKLTEGVGSELHVPARWQVIGRVQGVGFRWFVCQSAQRHGVAGDVCNLPDGSVEIRALAGDAALRKFRREVERGPGGSRVDRIEDLDANTVEDLEGFRVRHVG